MRELEGQSTYLRKQWENSYAGMATNNWYINLCKQMHKTQVSMGAIDNTKI